MTELTEKLNIDRRRLEQWMTFWSNIGTKAGSDDLFTLSAAVSFYLALSISPFLLILLAALSLLSGDLQDQLIVQVSALVGENASLAVAALINNMRNSEGGVGAVGVISLITLLITSSLVFNQLKYAVDVIIRRPEEPQVETTPVTKIVWGVVKQRLLAMGMVLTFILLTIVSLAASSVIGFLIAHFQSFGAFAAEVLNNLISLSVFTGFFAGFFAVVPRRKVGFRIALKAGLATAILFMIGKILIGLYLSSGAISSSYGAAGSFLALLTWVYYSSLIIFFGAEVANELRNVRDLRHREAQSWSLP